jgi:hypothetical protein
METQELFDILPQGVFTSVEELQAYIDEGNVDELYPMVNKQMFPTLEEFQVSLKKKVTRQPDDMGLPSEDGLSEQQDLVEETIVETPDPEELARQKEMDIVDVALEFPSLNYNELDEEGQAKIQEISTKFNQSPEDFLSEVSAKKNEITSQTYLQNLGNTLAKGDKSLGEMLVSTPGTIYSIANLVSTRAIKELEMLGIDAKIDGKDNITEKEFNELIGTGPILDKLIEEQEYRQKKGDIWNQSKGIKGGPVENFSKGNFSDGFKQLGNMLAESAPVSLGIMMAAFSGLGIGQIARGGTLAMTGPELRKQREENPGQTEAENILKATGLAGAEMVFSAISNGSLGKVYKEVIFKEGVEQGAKTFQKGLVSMYQQALKKYGAGAAAVGEGTEEVATQITQNLINGKPALEGVPDAFTVGLAGGAVYGAPINTAQFVNKRMVEPFNEATARRKINKIIEPSEVNNITEAFRNPEIGQLQVDLSKLKRADEILDKDLKKQVEAEEITLDEAKQIKQNLNDTQIIDVKLDAAEITGEEKITAANLLREKIALQKKIGEINDPTLSVKEQEGITKIDEQLAAITKTTEEKVTEEVVEDETATLDETVIEEQVIEEEVIEAPAAEVASLIETIGDPNMGIEETIIKGREEGFSDAAITKVLQQRGFKVVDIKPQLETETSLPAAFRNVTGGINVGKPIFDDVQNKLDEYTDQNPDAKKGVIREKALQFIRENQDFQDLTGIDQQQLEIAFDRTLGTQANKFIQKEISDIKKSVKEYKRGIKDLKEAQNKVNRFIRNSVPNEKSINKFVSSINKVTSKDDLPAVAESIIGEIENIREKQKIGVINKIKTLARKKAKTRKTRSNKIRGGDLTAAGKQFFQAVDEIMKAVIGKDPVNDMVKIADELSDIAEIERVTNKELAREKLTTAESRLLDRVLAFDMFGDVQEKSLEEVQDLFTDLQAARAESIRQLNFAREVQAKETQELQKELDAQIQPDYDFLYKKNKDGNLEPKNKNELNQDRAEIYRNFGKLKIWKGLTALIKTYNFTIAPNIYAYPRNLLSNLQSMTKILDRYNDTGFFKKYFYDETNVAEENALRGKFNQYDKLNDIAASIEGVNDYNDILKLLNDPEIELDIKGKATTFSADNLARIYALSKNDIQRQKLLNMGYTDSVMKKIDDSIPPQAREFIDKLVDYLSTDYYESVNDVYSKVNNLNLPQIQNYFPTRTLSDAEFSSDLLAAGDFKGIFDVETAPALKSREDLVSDIDLGLGLTFTNTLTSHFETLEKYKAFAQHVKKLNSIMKLDGMGTLLSETGTLKLIRSQLNSVVNPSYGLDQIKPGILTKTANAFTGYALAFRLIQIPKQATSFVQAFTNYRYNKSGKPNFVKDLFGFSMDMLRVISRLPKEMKEMKEISASFKDRYEKGFAGDLYGLETGGRLGLKTKKQQLAIIRKAKSSGAYPTVLGDALGILGYKINYNRNIKNGMSKQEALKAFNDYNATQQSRRQADKIVIQQSKNEYARFFTMFMSTTYLQMNQTAQGMSSIMKDISQGKKPKETEMRRVAINAYVANAMFIAVSNFAKFAFGDEKDIEEAKQRLRVSRVVLNLIYAIPVIGAGVEEVVNRIDGNRIQAATVTNPYISIAKRMYRLYEKEGGLKTLLPLGELILGARTDPFIGLANTFKDQEIDEDNLLDMLGTTSYYRPREKKVSKPVKQKMSGDFVDPELKAELDALDDELNAIKKELEDALSE